MKYGDMTLSVEVVTPAVAKRWLEMTNTKNRRLRKQEVDKYARDMQEGRWHRKPIAVCWGEDGSLGNGQHTLHAIVKSGVAQELLVARDVPAAAIAIMDVGLRRSVADVAHFLGVDMESRKGAIARVITFGPRDNAPRSFDELFDAYLRHDEKIDHICGLAPKQPGFSASSIAVMVRASYHCDMAQIERFIEIIKSGEINGVHESAAIRIRDFCRSLRGASRSTRGSVYEKTEAALSYFLKGKPMTKVYGSAEELFPLPAESLAKAA